MHQSPRTRRLRSDLAALERLRSESSVFRFSSVGDPPQTYQIVFHGKGLARDRTRVKVLEQHRVEIKLGASYPRSMPEMRWVTPVYHPNISEIGMICLGGYGTHWVPSIQLDELCVMLWDMVRFYNYDIRSPYNRECALWTAGQTTFRFPIDARPLRDLRASQGRGGSAGDKGSPNPDAPRGGPSRYQRAAPARGANDNHVGRVLDFIVRYGRDKRESPAPAATRENPPAAPQPAPGHVRQGVEPADRVANVADHEMGRALVSADIPHPGHEPEPVAAARADRSQAVLVSEEQSDVLIVESSSDDAPFEGPRRGADDDEVIFID